MGSGTSISPAGTKIPEVSNPNYVGSGLNAPEKLCFVGVLFFVSHSHE